MSKKQMFSCPYCGTRVRTDWQSGAKPVCPNCNAQLEEAAEKTAEKAAEKAGDAAQIEAAAESITKAAGSIANVIGMLIGLLVCLGILFAGYTFLSREKTADPEQKGVTAQTENSIYVEEIGRTCRWIPSAESYYDSKTDCHFWYNNEIEYPIWQYFYGGISTDYGDYGWMEYREDKGVWMIEESAGHWVELPETYDTEKLWHIQEE